MSYQKPIIDSHCHLWDLSLNQHPWLRPTADKAQSIPRFNQFEAIKKDYLLADYRRDSDRFAIEKMVHIQAGWQRSDPLGETRWLTSLHEQHGLPHAIVAYADLLSPTIDQDLAALSHFPLVKGIRQIVAWHQDPAYRACEQDFLSDPLWQENFALLERYGFSFDLQIYPEQADQAYDLLARHPSIPVVIEHLLQPTQHTPEYLSFWQQQLAKLATLPQVSIKLSGAFSFQHEWSPSEFHHLLRSVIPCFGAERCMFGSNFPVEKRFVDFHALLDLSHTALKAYSPEEQHLMFYQSAAQFYGL